MDCNWNSSCALRPGCRGHLGIWSLYRCPLVPLDGKQNETRRCRKQPALYSITAVDGWGSFTRRAYHPLRRPGRAHVCYWTHPGLCAEKKNLEPSNNTTATLWFLNDHFYFLEEQTSTPRIVTPNCIFQWVWPYVLIEPIAIVYKLSGNKANWRLPTGHTTRRIGDWENQQGRWSRVGAASCGAMRVKRWVLLTSLNRYRYQVNRPIL